MSKWRRAARSWAALPASMPAASSPRWQQVELLLASDVDNPALGEQGAAAVFGPQKGADAQQVVLLEAQLTHFFTLIHEQTGATCGSCRRRRSGRLRRRP